MRVLGRYVLHEPLGRGATASVELGTTRREDGVVIPVAVKQLDEERARDPNAVARFLDEVRVARNARHPNIVEVIELVWNGEQMAVVMEYVHGESLATLLGAARRTGERLPPAVACAIAHDVLLGLEAAHQARAPDGTPLAIVHRDVTPENVLVGADGVVKLTDFGVARAEGRLHRTSDGGVRGKLAYLAPEQIGGDVTQRTDLYAVGLVLWEMLVLERPLEGPNEAAIVARALDPDIPPPSARVPGVPPALDAVVMRALAKDPEARFATAGQFADALARAIDLAPREAVAALVHACAGDRLDARARSIAAVTTTSSPRPRPSRLVAGALVAAGFVAALGTALALGTTREAPPVRAAVATGAAAPAPPPPAPSPSPSSSPSIVDPPPPEPPPATGNVVAPAPAPRRPQLPKAHTSCDPPWYVDDHGIKRYDPACVK